MGFLGFKSRKEKELRLQINDLREDARERECEKNNIPYFGIIYADDYRNIKGKS